MMQMEHRLVQGQSQRLMLTQKMQQALQILQYNAQELDLHIQNELEANPVLEQVAPPTAAEPAVESPSTEGHDTANFDDAEYDLDAFTSRWEKRIQEGRDLSVNGDLAAKRDYYENSITQNQSLSSKLMTQLNLAFGDTEDYGIGERIIGDIDDRGYFTGSVEGIAAETGIATEDVERVLYRIQRFEPLGIGARDLTECLLIQIQSELPDEPELVELVEHHLDDLQHRQIPAIAKAMKTTPERVEELKNLLATLNPWPGRGYASEPTQYIIPDLIVEKEDGTYVVRLTEEGSPKLEINEDYQALSKTKGMEKDEKSFLREKVESAKWLIRNVEQRQQTILKIGKAIIDVQREFLDKGVDKIRPLTLQEIADVVGVHEATVSRTTRGKYIQTPQGLFELKYFFSTGLKTSSGEDQSSKSVQLQVKKIIEAEDKRKPLSDQKIADKLKAEGLSIARRTVTKYREALGIPSTTKRRQY
jgi:RNA polymerase sigma-54 factor